MKLKTVSANSGPTAESPLVEKTAIAPHRPPSASELLPPVQQPFESFVRSMVATKKPVPASQLPGPASPAAEEVIAQTEVDGVRYVILRCELSSRETNVNLSPREREIVSLIAKGFPNKAIADVLEISTWTVGTHLRRVFAKMGVTSRAAMVAKHLQVNAGGISARTRGAFGAK